MLQMYKVTVTALVNFECKEDESEDQTLKRVQEIALNAVMDSFYHQTNSLCEDIGAKVEEIEDEVL